MRWDQIKVFCGGANPALAQDVCLRSASIWARSRSSGFPTARSSFRFWKTCAARMRFAVQPTCTPVEQHLFELLLMIDALKRARRTNHRGAAVLRLRAAGS